MPEQTRPTSVRTFITVWIGQTVSLTGSSMTGFALTIWVWQLTGSATALALFGFATQLPRILVAPFAGVIADRCNRKLLMVVGDTAAGLSTLALLLLCVTGSLQLWHLYLWAAVSATFGQFQELAHSASLSLMVPQRHYSRACSMGFLASYGSNILAPALAGALYPAIGLSGILIADLTTFLAAVGTVLLSAIPQPNVTESHTERDGNMLHEMGFGWRYIAGRPSLLALLVLGSVFWFVHDFGASLYSPAILARTGSDAAVLGAVASAAGAGGAIGALAVSAWGGPKRRVRGMLLGMAGAGLSKTVFGTGQMLFIWVPAQFCSSVNFPLLGSCTEAIWLAKVKPEVQGRVFATRSTLVLLASTAGYLIAAPLADRVFEPAMMPGGALAGVFGGVFGTGSGAGMALLYTLSSICMLLVAIGGYACRPLRDAEILLPDRDAP